MKSRHKENTDLYFIIQQLSLDKLFKCDCVGRKKKHDFGSFQKWQIWPNSTIEKNNWYMEFQHETNIVLKDLFFRWNAETN